MAELEDELAVVLVDRASNRPPERNSRIVVDHRVVRHDATADVHGYKRRDDRPDPAFGELHFPVDASLIARAVVVVEPPRDVRPENAVFDRQVPELKGREDDVSWHRQLLRTSSGTR